VVEEDQGEPEAPLCQARHSSDRQSENARYNVDAAATAREQAGRGRIQQVGGGPNPDLCEDVF
jgi:hypothetical protein